jgi:hypothetical protein
MAAVQIMAVGSRAKFPTTQRLFVDDLSVWLILISGEKMFPARRLMREVTAVLLYLIYPTVSCRPLFYNLVNF